MRCRFIGLLIGLGVGNVSNASAVTPVPELVTAVRSGNISAVEALLAKGTPSRVANVTEPDGTGALDWAVRGENLQIAGMLLRAGADANAVNRYGVTPLSLAATAGNGPMVALLLRSGADVKKAGANLPDGESLLMLAARTGGAEAVETLAASGLDVNAREPRTGTTALMWAALENRPFVIKALLRAGARIDDRSTIAIWPHTPPAIIGDALEEGQSYVGQSQLPKGGWTALIYAAREGAFEAAQTLANAGADLNATDPYGTSALEYAIINGHYGVAKALVDKGADVNLADTAGMTPLYAAVDMHTLESTFGRQDLSRTVVDGAADMIRYLLADQADPNARLKSKVHKRVFNPGDGRLGEGATPLMRAARGGDALVFRMLLDAGADPGLKQKSGAGPILLAAGVRGQAGNSNPEFGSETSAVEVVKMCLDRGLDVNEASANSDTPIHAAVGSPALIRLLAEHGARLDVKNRRGQTPVEAAQLLEPGNKSLELLRQLAASK